MSKYHRINLVLVIPAASFRLFGLDRFFAKSNWIIRGGKQVKT